MCAPKRPRATVHPLRGDGGGVGLHEGLGLLPGAAPDQDGRFPFRTSPSSVNWLTHSSAAARHLREREVERPLRAVEQAQAHRLGGQALRLRGGVAPGGADQREQARADRADLLAVDVDAGPARPAAGRSAPRRS